MQLLISKNDLNKSFSITFALHQLKPRYLKLFTFLKGSPGIASNIHIICMSPDTRIQFLFILNFLE